MALVVWRAPESTWGDEGQKIVRAQFPQLESLGQALRPVGASRGADRRTGVHARSNRTAAALRSESCTLAITYCRLTAEQIAIGKPVLFVGEPPTSPSILQLETSSESANLLAHPVPEERGLTEILDSSPCRAFESDKHVQAIQKARRSVGHRDAE